MNVTASSAPRRGPLFWILVVGGIGVASCCGLSLVGALMFSATTEFSTDLPPGEAGGASWLPAGEIARGTTLTQPLAGRWVYQSGGSVDSVVARSGATAWVQTNSSGTLYAFTFEEDGDYVMEWASAVTVFGGTSRSSCIEKGSWTLADGRLTLEPKTQRATYITNAGLSQDKEDVDLSSRPYQLVDIEMQTIEATGAPLKRFRGVEISGPAARWDVSRERLELDLQRL